MFWTNWNPKSPSIQKSFLNGFMVQTIIKTDINMPNAITLDFMEMKLYWSDARLDKIERCETDGSNRVVMSSDYSLSQIQFDYMKTCFKII